MILDWRININLINRRSHCLIRKNQMVEHWGDVKCVQLRDTKEQVATGQRRNELGSNRRTVTVCSMNHLSEMKLLSAKGGGRDWTISCCLGLPMWKQTSRKWCIISDNIFLFILPPLWTRVHDVRVILAILTHFGRFWRYNKDYCTDFPGDLTQP